MKKTIWMMAISALLCACSGKNAQQQGTEGAASGDSLTEVTVKYATAFSVRDSAGIRLVDVGKHDHFALVRSNDVSVPDGYTKIRFDPSFRNEKIPYVRRGTYSRHEG